MDWRILPATLAKSSCVEGETVCSPHDALGEFKKISLFNGPQDGFDLLSVKRSPLAKWFTKFLDLNHQWRTVVLISAQC